MSSFLWIMFLKCGSIIVIPRKVLQCSFEADTFGDIVNNLQSKVAKVSISSNAMFIDPNHDVPLNAPLSLRDQLKCMFVCINVSVSELFSVLLFVFVSVYKRCVYTHALADCF